MVAELFAVSAYGRRAFPGWDYRFRLARRLTFFLLAQEESKQRRRAPDIRVCPLRGQTSLPPALLRGHVTKGRPCPFVTRSASMPRDPLRNACARPSEGGSGAVPTALQQSLHRDHRCPANADASVIRGRSGRELGPLRRPSGVGPLEDRWSEGTPAQPGPDVGCAFSLVTFSLHKQRESNSP